MHGNGRDGREVAALLLRLRRGPPRLLLKLWERGCGGRSRRGSPCCRSACVVARARLLLRLRRGSLRLLLKLWERGCGGRSRRQWGVVLRGSTPCAATVVVLAASCSWSGELDPPVPAAELSLPVEVCCLSSC